MSNAGVPTNYYQQLHDEFASGALYRKRIVPIGQTYLDQSTMMSVTPASSIKPVVPKKMTYQDTLPSPIGAVDYSKAVVVRPSQLELDYSSAMMSKARAKTEQRAELLSRISKEPKTTLAFLKRQQAIQATKKRLEEIYRAPMTPAEKTKAIEDIHRSLPSDFGGMLEIGGDGEFAVSPESILRDAHTELGIAVPASVEERLASVEADRVPKSSEFSQYVGSLKSDTELKDSEPRGVPSRDRGVYSALSRSEMMDELLSRPQNAAPINTPTINNPTASFAVASGLTATRQALGVPATVLSEIASRQSMRRETIEETRRERESRAMMARAGGAPSERSVPSESASSFARQVEMMKQMDIQRIGGMNSKQLREFLTSERVGMKPTALQGLNVNQLRSRAKAVVREGGVEADPRAPRGRP
jgi:hypothetical protein